MGRMKTAEWQGPAANQALYRTKYSSVVREPFPTSLQQLTGRIWPGKRLR